MKIKSILRITGMVSLLSSCVLSVDMLHSKAASAQAEGNTASANCPGIFYQEPFTNRVAAPVGCPFTRYQAQLQQATSELDPGLEGMSTGDQPESLETLQSEATNGNLGTSTGDQPESLETLQSGATNSNLEMSTGDQPSSIEELRSSNPTVSGTGAPVGAVVPLPDGA